MLEAYPGTRAVREALAEEFDGVKRRLFHLLVHMFGTSRLETARLGYFSGMDVRRSLAIEVVDNLLERDLKAMVLPILEELPDEERLEALQRFVEFEAPAGSAWHTIVRIALREPSELSAFTRAVCLFEIGRMNPPADFAQYVPRIQFFRKDPTIAVREAAEQALMRLNFL